MKFAKITAGLCAWTLVFSGVAGGLPVQAFSLTASAEKSGTLGENLTYTLSADGELSISGEGEWDKDAYFWPTINKQDVTTAFVKNGITNLPSSAFAEYSNLAEVFLSDSVNVIGAGAFSKCSALNAVTFGEGVTEIGKLAFDGCTSLTGIRIPDTVTAVGNGAFHACTALQSVIFSKNMTAIAPTTFADCTALTVVPIPSNVTTIGNNAFSGCSSLTSVTVLNPDATIGKTSVTLGDPSGTTIHGYENSTAQKYAGEYGYIFIVLDEAPASELSGTCGENLTWTLDEEGTLTISGTGAMTDYIGESVPSWTDKKEDIKSIVIEDGVTSIGDQAFYQYTDLISVTIPGSVTSIGNYAFDCCTNLTDITIPDGVTSIGDDAFFKCTSLTGITIPDSVTGIGSNAFYACFALADITIPDSVTSIGMCAFYGTKWLKTQEEEKPLVIVNSILISGKKSSGDITIPDGVISIGGQAFYNCVGLTSVTIPESVTSIGYSAFWDCENLTSITIPSSVTNIGNGTFVGCNDLTIKGITGSCAETYANENNIPFEAIGEAPAVEPFPDMDGNNEITASDAQVILVAFAELVADNPSGLTPEQEAAADVNGDGKITALDAQYTLTYYLYNSILDDPVTWDELLHPNGE